MSNNINRNIYGHFEKHGYKIDIAKITDIPALLKLDKECWGKELCASREQISRRIKNFPQGQLVIKLAKRIIAVLYTQKIVNPNDLFTATYKDVSNLHQDHGTIVQLICINAANDMQDDSIGYQLREYALKWIASMGGIEKVVAVTRCKNYKDYAHLSLDQYIQKHKDHPEGVDSILRFHTSRGAQIRGIVPNYRPEDKDNLGAGVLIEYDILTVQEVIEPSSLDLQNQNIEDRVDQIFLAILPTALAKTYSHSLALREMGIDSLKLLELNTLLNLRFKLKLDPTFFFQYGTPAAIIDYLKKHNSPSLNATSKAEASSMRSEKNEAIAVIGMACRLPGGVKNLDSFWELLKEGKNAITSVPEQRKKSLGTSLAYGGFIEDIECFDADFFHISPREAKLMDPQQRLLLEVSWEALEEAGIAVDALKESQTGVFIGMFSHDYENLLTKDKDAKKLDAYFATGNATSIAAGRISYALGLQGPALVVDTACSSSLVAVHLACQSLRLGDCKMALVGSANIILSPELNLAFTNAGMLSPDGLCKTFDAKADGYVRSEACTILVLKTLSQAEADQDTILAVIRSSVVNQDGASNGLTAPNVDAQINLLSNALATAQVSADSISYIEAHGTGTSLGDPIEMKAISAVYAASRKKDSPLWIGSVKTNIGHTEACAGMAGLMKTILMMQHKQIVPHLHFNNLNPYIQLDTEFFKIPTKLSAWESLDEKKLRASISSFGFSGTNAHVIVEQAPRRDKLNSSADKPAYLLTFSAKTAVALKQVMQILDDNLANKAEYMKAKNIGIKEIAYTLNRGRSHFEIRGAIIAATLSELRDTLRKIKESIPVSNVFFKDDEEDRINNKISHEQIFSDLNLTLSVDEYRDTLSKLAKNYVAGFDIDWETFYRGQVQRRISLPTYPFAKEKYWFTTEVLKEPMIKHITHQEKAGLVNLQINAEGIALIKMEDKAGKNQFSFALLQALEDVFAEIKNNSIVKVVVITGYDDIFCLGGAEEVLLAVTKGEITYTDLPFMYKGLLDCPYPVISAMQGHAFGAGLSFGLYADIAVMSLGNLYAANFMKYGFTPGVGSTFILKEKLSDPIAFEMMWTAREFTGAELKSRAAKQIFKEGAEVLNEAMNIARGLAKKPRYSLMIFKKEMANILLAQLPQAIERELYMHREIFTNTPAADNVKNHFSKLASFNDDIPVESMVVEEKITVLTDLTPKPKVANEKVVNTITEIVSNKLHLPVTKIDINRSFRELGVDSISAVEIVRELSHLFELNIEAAMIYDYPSIKQLANYLEQELHQSDSTRPLVTEQQIVPSVSAEQTKPKLSLKSTQQSSSNYVAADMKTSHATTQLKPLGSVTPILETDIAIIGYSGRFPGAQDADAFWENLVAGASSVTEVPKDRWSIADYYASDHEAANKTYSKWGGYLSDIDQFDPLFFGLSPAEAEQMDPQQRLFLEESWKVFEASGYSSADLKGKKCAVFVGVNSGDYDQLVKMSGADTSAQLLLGMNCSVLSSRISYHLDLKGPSIAVDTACSSSLVALHQACQSLWTGESEMALAGGVCILTTPEMHIMTSKAGMLSSEGLCKTFDNAADGFVPGECVGVVLLKPLKQALADKDIIHAVIKGSSVNQDGKTNGITAPSAKSQTELEREVYKKFNIDPKTISYVEAHGTGTKLGDPIEVSALTRSFRAYTDQKQYCAIGSVKTNIGHTLLAAGIASVIKVLLCLKYKKLVPTLNYQHENEHINFADSPFYVNTELKNWDSLAGSPRRAAINSFGLSGTNAHMVLEEAPIVTQTQTHKTTKPAYLLALSARTENQLEQKIRDLQVYLSSHELDLADIAYTLNTKRSHFDYRCALIVISSLELKETLLQIVNGGKPQNYLSLLQKNPEQSESLFDEDSTTILKDLAAVHNIDASSYRKKLFSLADLYIKGHEVQWDDLFIHETKQKVFLPTYPFARERHWVSAAKNSILVSKVELKSSNQTILLDNIRLQIMQMVSSILKINIENLDVTQNLSTYGLDSIITMSLTNAINKRFQLQLTPAILFEHPTFDSFAKYLVDNYSSVLSKKVEMTPPVTTPTFAIQNEDIAIIGMSGILPNANDLKQFWKNLEIGIDGISEIPKSRWDWEEHYGDPHTQENKTLSKWGGFINDVDLFDAAFFNISPREAELIDPQQRLFLQVVWQTIEDAGYAPDDISLSKAGVFVGVVSSDYAELLHKNNIAEASTLTGNTRTMIANRISYLLNWQGPSEAIDTACSSSLVAIHHAINAIRNGDCEVAIAGGVNALLTPTSYIAASKAGMLSADGLCKTFDKSADGYVRAEGVAAILLKRLSQAQADGDVIYGVIKGSAINHGGHVSSLTVPNPNAQSDVILAAHKRAQIPIDTLSYIETHGTGTALGDPIEINGLKKAFKQLGSEQNQSNISCGLGSVKSNIGHLESAAGMASVIKVLLAMKEGIIPGNLHYKELNPYIELADSPFYIINKTQAWARKIDASGFELPRRAGVSAFGFGGVNAHLVIEEGPISSNLTMTPLLKPSYLITLSAKQEESLKQKIADLHTWLETSVKPVNIESLSFTLNVGRNHFKNRCALVVNSISELYDTLGLILQGQNPKNYFASQTSFSQSTKEQVFAELYKSAISVLKNYAFEDAVLYRDKLLLLADLFTKNYPIEWNVIHIDETKKRLAALPSYPFAKQRFWFHSTNQVATTLQPVEITSPTAKAEDIHSFTLAYLQNIFAKKLKLSPEQIAVDNTYEVYGVESLLGLEITKCLEEDFGDLPKTLLYEKNQLVDLAQYLEKKYPQVLIKLSGQAQEISSSMPVFVEPQAPAQAALHEDIAIIGLSGTYPMAKDINEFWDNLEHGRDCISEVPIERWNYRDYPVNLGGEDKYYQYGGFLPDVDKFDPLFFNIAPKEAALLDPQERLFMQSAWATLEDAGYTRESLKRSVDSKVGVFVGVTYNFYPLFIAEEWHKGNRIPLDIQLFSIANRVSYFLNVNGPSYIVDTACSSSSSAIHLACESIRRGECVMAIAGGVNLSLHPIKYHMLGSYSFMSEQGRCTSFGENGSGYVPGEGVGSVLLKPLSLAIKDKDHIYGVIKSSSMNHGGKTSGYTVPNPSAQTKLIKMALKQANIDARSISYIEAHGTGTALGDPIEIRGLQEAFEDDTQDKQYCSIGSVKSNIGHLESAAGISQLTKVLLQMRHKKLTASLHSKKLNPYIDFTQTPFYVQQELSEWKTPVGQARRAGVSSFGAGGTNVHFIVEEYLSSQDQLIAPCLPFVLLLSALNTERLDDQIKQMSEFLRTEVRYYDSELKKNNWLSNVCYTTQAGRESFATRLAILAVSFEDLVEKLEWQFNSENRDSIKETWFNSSAQATPANAQVTEWLQQAQYAKLAEAWTQGSSVNWQLLYKDQASVKVSLPTYPFAKRRCWITSQDKASKLIPAPLETLEVNPELNSWLYSMDWALKPQDNTITQRTETHWLIFDNEQLHLHLQQELTGSSYTHCLSGLEFKQISADTFCINPLNPEDYHTLLSKIHADKKRQLKGIIFVSAALQNKTTDDLCTFQVQHEPSQQVFTLLQAVVHYQWQQKLQLCLITQNSQVVTEHDSINMWTHHLWSMLRIFSAEKPEFPVLLLDVAAKDYTQNKAKYIAQELMYFNAKENHIAYRDNQRYVLKLKKTIIQETKVKKWQAPESAIITGGLGALGGEVAIWLAQQGAQYILLTGTTILPEPSLWSGIQDPLMKEKITIMQTLEKMGVNVRYAAVDITDKSAMQALVIQVEANWNKAILGVFHLAGMTTDNITIDNMSGELLQKVLAVKIQGSLVLHDIFNKPTLKCFVLFSSISALPYFGIGGLSAYAMANEFLNGLALFRRGVGLPAMSIDWVAWADKGMSFKYNHSQFLAAIGMSTVGISTGMGILEWLMSLQPEVIAVCQVQWETFLRVNPDAKHLTFFDNFIDKNQTNITTSRASNLNKEQISDLITQILAEILELEVHEIEAQAPFQNYGLDSIIGIHFVTKLNEKFSDTVSPMDLYRYPCVQQLTSFIIKSYEHTEPAQVVKTSSSTFNESSFLSEIEHLQNNQLEELIENELSELNDI